MKVAIRVDASSVIGSGHVMRCVVVAKKLLSQGHDVRLLSREFAGNLIQYCQQQALTVIALPGILLPEIAVVETRLSGSKPETDNNQNDYAHWLGVSQQQDAAQCLETLKAFNPDWVVVDHYALSETWERLIQKNGAKILAIDDLADRQHHCQLLLDHNPWPNLTRRYDNLIPSDCVALLGPKYALLREAFSRLRIKKAKHVPIQNQLLVFFSGADPSGENLKLLNACQRFSSLPFQVKIIYGLANPLKKALLAQSCPDFVSLFEHIPNVEHELAVSRYAFGGAGVSAIERASLSIPATLVSVAENQRLMAEHLAGSGLYRYLGSSEQTSIDSYFNELLWLSQQWEILPLRLPKFNIDGLGVDRLIGVMEKINKREKKARLND